MNLLIETKETRREVKDGFKLYGSDTELREISDAIRKALSEGLVQGWVGIGTLVGDKYVFPNNDTRIIKTKTWQE